MRADGFRDGWNQGLNVPWAPFLDLTSAFSTSQALALNCPLNHILWVHPSRRTILSNSSVSQVLLGMWAYFWNPIEWPETWGTLTGQTWAMVTLPIGGKRGKISTTLSIWNIFSNWKYGMRMGCARLVDVDFSLGFCHSSLCLPPIHFMSLSLFSLSKSS